jgi:hypothetical protein
MAKLGYALVQHKNKNQSFDEFLNCNNVQWKILVTKGFNKNENQSFAELQ